MVGFRIQQRVQRLFDRRPNHFIQMRLNASFIDLYYRTQVPLDPVFRPSSRFHGWLHRARLRGLAPPACTNLHASNSNQMCERNPTLSGIESRDTGRIPRSITEAQRFLERYLRARYSLRSRRREFFGKLASDLRTLPGLDLSEVIHF